MVRLILPRTVGAQERRIGLARALRDLHAAELQRRSASHRGHLLQYHIAKRRERICRERVRAWRAVQLPEVVA